MSLRQSDRIQQGTPPVATARTHSSNGKRLPRSKRISQAITARDLTTLKLLARTGSGFQSIRLRRRAWPLLLNFRSLTDSGNRAAAHPDEGQVALDIPRTCLPKSVEYRSDAEATKRRQAQLSNVVQSVLRSYPWLSYYQGFHELTLTFLSVFGSERPAVEAAKMVSLFLVRDAMSSDLENVLQQLRLLYVILQVISPEIHDLLTELEVPAFFAISWVLTWFAHDLDDFGVICRIYDFLITMPPMQVVYMAAAMLKRNEGQILGYERDFATVHTELSKLPGRISNWDEIIDDSYYMQIDYPPTKLQHMGKCHLPKTSAINTYEATWKRLDPAQPLKIESLLPAVKGGRHPLDTTGTAETPTKSNRMAGVIDLTDTAQKARNLALQHKWPLMVATVASATMLMYALLLMQQLQLHT
ncbi:GTPase-activating protein gyp8 [Coemansia erecta]|uniref:GTPase-activating protein gyp8 n=1 Tax=Coemansia erecta TaxID=147472 RepID=A0A9W8CTJ2_9FUNG|nr:GTPase-activating protein gyp8 [Coemansia erecta]